MELSEFKKLIRMTEPLDLARKYIYQDSVHAINLVSDYTSYLDGIRQDYFDNEHLSIVGSGNWKYSLNPYNQFREFSEHSDIDIVVISRRYYEDFWEALREFHRNRYYSLNDADKTNLRRNGENVYCGFISPKWIPDRSSRLRLEYELNTDRYSNENIGYRRVNMMFFKNVEETLDYYVRGFILAKRKC